MNKEQILFFPEIPTYAWFSEGPDEYHRDANNCDPYYNISFESSFKKEVISAFSHLLNSDRSCSGIRFIVSPPDDATSGVQAYASKFSTDVKLKEALELVKPGSPAFNAGITTNSTLKVTVPGNFGYGFAKNSSVKVDMDKVTALYNIESNGTYTLISLYPDKL